MSVVFLFLFLVLFFFLTRALSRNIFTYVVQSFGFINMGVIFRVIIIRNLLFHIFIFFMLISAHLFQPAFRRLAVDLL